MRRYLEGQGTIFSIMTLLYEDPQSSYEKALWGAVLTAKVITVVIKLRRNLHLQAPTVQFIEESCEK